MKTKNTTSVLFLKNNNAICCYCGEPLLKEEKEESDRYSSWTWNEYECTCKDWNNAIELDNILEEMNEKFYEEYCNYMNKFDDLIKDTRKIWNCEYKIKEKLLKIMK